MLRNLRGVAEFVDAIPPVLSAVFIESTGSGNIGMIEKKNVVVIGGILLYVGATSWLARTSGYFLARGRDL